LIALSLLIAIGLFSLGIGIDAYRRHTERTPIIVLWNIALGIGMVIYGIGALLKWS
jgi:hypothetical protein